MRHCTAHAHCCLCCNTAHGASRQVGPLWWRQRQARAIHADARCPWLGVALLDLPHLVHPKLGLLAQELRDLLRAPQRLHDLRDRWERPRHSKRLASCRHLANGRRPWQRRGGSEGRWHCGSGHRLCRRRSPCFCRCCGRRCRRSRGRCRGCSRLRASRRGSGRTGHRGHRGTGRWRMAIPGSCSRHRRCHRRHFGWDLCPAGGAHLLHDKP
mmetsp:Transcript_93902/g.265706  ORF Transcript_93902/g.265706 Transcript_93902/m.265706 type:complete len:212 (+) Transcript_93902:302-937(+)